LTGNGRFDHFAGGFKSNSTDAMSS
jgi:hypothetical protein